MIDINEYMLRKMSVYIPIEWPHFNMYFAVDRLIRKLSNDC